MANQVNPINSNKLLCNKDKKLVNGVKILLDVIKRDIEKSYNLDTIKGTEAYYSNRYGWILRKTID